MKKEIVFVDMDGVLADFVKGIGRNFVPHTDPPEMLIPGFFRNLEVLPGAKEGIEALLQLESYELFIGSKPSNKATNSATEKMEWLKEHFPDLAKKCVLTSDKGLLRGEYLIDDDYDAWAHVFHGTYVHFDPKRDSEEMWKEVVTLFKFHHDSKVHKASLEQNT